MTANVPVPATCACRCQLTPRFVTLEEAAEYLLWSPWTVYNALRKHQWPYVRLAMWGVKGGHPRYRVAMQLDTYQKLHDLRMATARAPFHVLANTRTRRVSPVDEETLRDV